jgi:hypothetical protein
MSSGHTCWQQQHNCQRATTAKRVCVQADLMMLWSLLLLRQPCKQQLADQAVAADDAQHGRLLSNFGLQDLHLSKRKYNAMPGTLQGLGHDSFVVDAAEIQNLLWLLLLCRAAVANRIGYVQPAP